MKMKAFASYHVNKHKETDAFETKTSLAIAVAKNHFSKVLL